jgi:hypothetical protein
MAFKTPSYMIESSFKAGFGCLDVTPLPVTLAQFVPSLDQRRV